MTDNYKKLDEIEFYEYGGTTCKLAIMYNLKFKKYYISIARHASYMRDSGESITRDNCLYLAVPAMRALLEVGQAVVTQAETLENSKGNNILKVFIHYSH